LRIVIDSPVYLGSREATNRRLEESIYNKKFQKVFYSSQHCKVKLSLSKVQIHTREWRYSSTYSQHKMEMGGKRHAPTAIFLVPIVIKAEWVPEPVWKLQRRYKCLVKAWNQTKVSRLSSPQPSHCIKCTNLAPKLTLLWRLNHEGWDKIWSLTRKVTLS
jgi:hypothetical protein